MESKMLKNQRYNKIGFELPTLDALHHRVCVEFLGKGQYRAFVERQNFAKEWEMDDRTIKNATSEAGVWAAAEQLWAQEGGE